MKYRQYEKKLLNRIGKYRKKIKKIEIYLNLLFKYVIKFKK